MPHDGISVLLGRDIRARAHPRPREDTARRCGFESLVKGLPPEPDHAWQPDFQLWELQALPRLSSPSWALLTAPLQKPDHWRHSLGQGPEDQVDSASAIPLSPLLERTCGHRGVTSAGMTLPPLEGDRHGGGGEESSHLVCPPPHQPLGPSLLLLLRGPAFSPAAIPSSLVSEAPHDASSTQTFPERWRNQKLWVL